MKRQDVAVVVAILLVAAHAAAADSAEQIVKATGVRGGLVVHVGCGNGELTTALRAQGRFLVHGFARDADRVAQAREHVRQAGLAESVWIDRLKGMRLPHAENMVNLLVADRLGPGDPPMAEVMRVLAPLGVAWIGGKKVVKPWPDEIDEWTHWLHGADGNAVADDTRVGLPRRLKWVAGPIWSRSHDSVPSVSAMVSAGGRLFAIVDEAPASMDGSAPDEWVLVARDAFNGLELWRRPIGPWGWRAWATQFTVRFTVPTHISRRLVAVGNRVYATLAFNAPLTELDAATGKTLRTFEGTQNTDEILCDQGTLIVAINKAAQKPGPKKGPAPEPVRKWVAALDARTGRMRWKTGDYVGLRSKTGSMEPISHLSMAAGGGRVFFVDGGRIVSLNQSDGSEAWRIARPAVPEHKMRYHIRFTDMCSLVYSDGAVFFVQLDPGPKRVGWREVKGTLHAFSAKTGRQLWQHQCSSWGWGHPADVFVRGNLVWVTGYKDDLLLGLDPKTGEVRHKVSTFKAFDNGHHHRCYRNKATTRFLLTGYRGIELIDWDSGATSRNHWARGTCRYGVMPCNGMIYTTPHPCECYITSKLNGFVALAPPAEPDAGKAATPTDPLERGPAYGKVVSPLPAPGTSSDWPAYRHDSRRTGSTPSAIGTALKTQWQIKLGGQLTSPVAAGGRVIVARKAAREVVSLKADTGTEQWRFTAGGTLDTPPTIAGGLVVFGCADGWVYCLRATDGALVWRFRAAPSYRLVGAMGSLASPWPVHGSVLVRGDRVYCTAGRSSFLDGGIYAYALQLATGKVLAHETIRSEQDMAVGTGTAKPHIDTGVLSDVLVSHADKVYLRQRPLFARGMTASVPVHLHATGGLLDDSWFQRTRWYLGGAAVAEYLVFDDKRICGVRARKSIGGYGLHFAPGGKGFDLFASDLPAAAQPVLRPLPPTRKGEAPTPGKRRSKPSRPKIKKPADIWCIKVPVRINAMALAGDVLLAAGTPDVIYDTDPWAAYEGRRGGKLLVISAKTGTVHITTKLASPPVLDGLAVAGGRLYLATRDGHLLCMRSKE